MEHLSGTQRRGTIQRGPVLHHAHSWWSGNCLVHHPDGQRAVWVPLRDVQQESGETAPPLPYSNQTYRAPNHAVHVPRRNVKQTETI